MEVYTDYSSHSADSVNQKTKKMGAARGRFEKNAIRVSGDWSEQLSSKGKIYFYNCITEVSQWQKPPDWKLPDMDHEELLRRLGSREQVTVDGKSTKRVHVTSSVNVGGVRDSVYGNCLSPKRGKFTSDVRRVNQAAGDKFSPALMDSSVTRVHCLTELTPRSFNHRSRPTSRSSPKRHYDHRGSQAFGLTAQSRRHLTNNLSGRLHPTDDMDISPGSSPMSGGSSPSHTLANSQSTQPVKCVRNNSHNLDVSQRLTCSPSKASDVNNCSGDCTKKDNAGSGTLRQLVDAIRASIGGLLEQSPGSTTSKPIPSTSPQVSRSQSGTLYSHGAELPSKSYSSVNEQETHRSLTFSKPSMKNSFHLPPNEDRLCPAFGRAAFPQVPSEQQRSNLQSKQNVPGLVSTLTTLVNLIGSAKYSNTSAGDSPLASRTTTIRPTAVTNTQQTPIQSHPTSQRHCPVASPAIPSPLTPSIHTGTGSSGGSSGSTLTTSMLNSGCSLSSHQMDDFLSGLESVSQQARARSFKPTVEYYHSQRSQINNAEYCDAAILHSEYSNRLTYSPKVLTPTNHRLHYRPPDETDGRSHCASDSRLPLQSPNEKDRYRHLSESVNDESATTKDHAMNSCTVGPSGNADDVQSPVAVESPEVQCINRITRILNSPTTLAYIDPAVVSSFTDKTVERLEQEALLESRKFDKLQSVLYGELSAESKKLRALVRISEAKLAIHREKQTALQELMDAVENRKQLPNSSFSDDVM
ncbi:hypothetical protein EG68_09911 [Paragonimus skrjabini miyazakii]|uniref:WW domain-containing protein n=1 Tax=Paragonimus skrjabini miyazakii TaxID=59628 RepID=A0A8S9YJT0_9TREM|nr:hypothetical protein EG68_09911 [Paragonimus skrjabini miyazakii]